MTSTTGDQAAIATPEVQGTNFATKIEQVTPMNAAAVDKTNEKPEEADSDDDDADEEDSAESVDNTGDNDKVNNVLTTQLTPSQLKTLEKFERQLPDVIKKANGYMELWGFDLLEGEKFNPKVRRVLLNKFLKANNYNLSEAESQLIDTLKWRQEFRPLSAGIEEIHDEKFSKVGFITYSPENPSQKKVTTWNIYGVFESPKVLFEDLDKFMRWRVGLMEQGIKMLDFQDPDNCYMAQVHDYKNASFFRMDPKMKKATTATIKIFSRYYPELLSQKYFVNVPALMGWVFPILKAIIPKDTFAKFYMFSDGKTLAKHIKGTLPDEYGGRGGSLAEMSVNRNQVIQSTINDLGVD